MVSSSSTLISSSSSFNTATVLTPSSTLGDSLDEPLPTFTLTVDEVDQHGSPLKKCFGFLSRKLNPPPPSSDTTGPAPSPLSIGSPAVELLITPSLPPAYLINDE
ncbi:hypothetical protein Agabi119p4_1371 [Agaricus bisporus var. burnettii]|uniref:Uncharacterized protein n=1 Tax=Agaricus bisporus var. burnettii TaxID=192524 RepID=A0A8H7FD83_AGABI|nr:hypothetical protein Agabi119p4_1371 [Agaricus bisporus var. burnettii]